MSGHPELWTEEERSIMQHHFRHFLPLLSLPHSQATSLPSSLCRLSNHLNTKRKDAGASWQWHPVFLIVGDTHPASASASKSSSGRIETPRLMLSLRCIKLNSHCVRKLYKYLGWVINSCSDSWRDTIYPSERAAVFPGSEIATPNGAEEQMLGPLSGAERRREGRNGKEIGFQASLSGYLTSEGRGARPGSGGGRVRARCLATLQMSA